MKSKRRVKAHEDTDNKPINRGDIRNLLRAYSGAIALDQIRVDALPPDSFAPAYYRGMWLRWRRCHVAFINQLLETTRDVSRELLQNLNLVAITAEPAFVRKVVVNLLGTGAANSLAPGVIDTAPLFFAALVEDIGTGWTRLKGGNHNARARFESWLDVTDPLSIAEDPECLYLAQLKESVDGKARIS
jgi:hypothetical protein